MSLLLTHNMHQGVHPSWRCPISQAEQTFERTVCFQWRSLLNKKFAVLISEVGYWSFICRITTFNLKYSFARTEKICCQTYCRRDFVFSSTHSESNLLIKQLSPQSNQASCPHLSSCTSLDVCFETLISMNLSGICGHVMSFF